MAIYYYNFQMERGEYYGYVENSNGKDVWNVRYPDFYEDEESGELLESTTIFEDGLMKDATDIEGLEDYLKKMSILKSGDELEFIDDDDNYAHGGEINYKKIKRKGEDEKYGFKYIVREQGDNYVIVEDEKIEQWEKSSPVDRKMYYEDLLPKEEVDNEFEYFADGGVITAPKNYVFVKFGSHRAREKAKSKNIKFVSLFSFGERSSAGTSINFMTESDYRNIKDIVGVSLVKNLKGKWFPRDENVSLRKKIHPLLDAKFEFAEGGTLNTRVINKIKAQKPTELPLEVSVYVPSTREASQIISKREYNQRIEEVQRYLADLFGGFSSVSVEGGYVSSEKGLIHEDATRVVAFASREGFEKKLDTLLKQIVDWCAKWSQESMGFEFEGDLFYIEATSKFNDGGETDDDDRSYGRYEDYDDDFQKRMNFKNFNKANRVSSVGGRRLSNEYRDLDEDDHTSPIDIPYETFLKDYNSGKMAKGGLTYKDLSQEKPQIINDLDNKPKKFKVDEIDLYRKGQKSFEGSSKITGSESAVKIFRQFWDGEALSISEHMNVMLLNRANKVIGIYQHSKGGIAGTVLEPQMIVLVAVKSLAKGVIIAHNHPSGNLQPSETDKVVSKKIKQALSLVDVTLLDSIIVTNDSYYSLMDEGFLERGGIMAKGGVIASSLSKEGIIKLISQYYMGSTISLHKTSQDDTFDVHNLKGKINEVMVVRSKGRFKFIK